MIGIYKIISPKGKIYIGQSVNIERRFKKYKRIDCNRQPKLYNSFIKYGIENHIFEIIEECSVELLNERERFHQDLHDVLNKGLNLVVTKINDKFGYASKETLKRMSESRIGYKCSNETKMKISATSKLRICSNETKLKISKSSKGKVHSDETKQKISNSKKNNLNPMFGKFKDSHHNYGKTWKMKLFNKKSIIILNSESGIFYTDLKECAFYNNLNHKTLHGYLSGFRKNKTNLIYA